MVFEPCDRVLGPERKGNQSPGLELVCMQFRKQRLARLTLWAASCGPDPSFTMVFEPCDRVRGPERNGSQSVRFGTSFEQFRKQRLVS